MTGYWRERVRRRVIHDVDAGLPKDATIKARRAALRKAAGEFQGASWPSQVWQQERRKYLATYGERPADAGSPKLLAAMESGDIIFPFRGEQGNVSDRQAVLQQPAGSGEGEEAVGDPPQR